MKNITAILLVAAIIAYCMTSCTTGRGGCYATHGMSGYGH